jgi:transposase
MERLNKERGRKRQKGGNYKYDSAFKRKVAMDYVTGDRSIHQLSRIYNIPNQNISRWVKEYSSELVEEESKITPMTAEEQKDFEALKKQNEALKKKLDYEHMRNFALETMIDLAKTELGIDLRKNSGAKQPKK